MKPSSPFYPHCLAAFKQSNLFSELDQVAMAAMLRGFRRETWAKGSRVPPGRLRERFHVVTRGRLELIKCNPQTGRELTVFLLGPGDAFDVITLLDGKEHGIDPLALDSVDTLSVPMATVREWINTHPAFNRTLLPYLGEQMRALEDLATDLALHDTVTRLGKLIMRHAAPDHSESNARPHQLRLINDLSHEVLARMIGSVRVVVSRHIEALTRKGALSTGRRHLALRNLNAVLDLTHQGYRWELGDREPRR